MKIPGPTLLIEIESGQTAKDAFRRRLVTVGTALDIPEQRGVIYRGNEDFRVNAVRFTSARTYLMQK